MRSLRLLAIAILLLAGACGDDDSSAGDDSATSSSSVEPSSTTAASDAPLPDPDDEPFVVLVTNDDGIGAPGIDALVEALRVRPDLELVVVAPLENQSGSSDRTTPDGAPGVVDASTASGFAGHAVDGFPADAVNAAFDELGIDPDLVISGINAGQNIGPLAELSGTVGAARTAARRGVPAIAVSAGIAAEVDYAAAVAQLEDVLDRRLETLVLDSRAAGDPVVLNLNVPTCAVGAVRGLVEVPLQVEDRKLGVEADCTSTAPPDFADDVEAFINGYAALADAGY